MGIVGMVRRESQSMSPSVRARKLVFALGFSVIFSLTAGLMLAPAANASYLVGTNLKGVSLKVNKKSSAALVSYKKKERGKWRKKHLIAWGKVNAGAGKRTRFFVDRSGGWKTKGRHGHWKTFQNACKRYSGPKEIKFSLRKCTVTVNGTKHHWAVQKWRRIKPNYGGTTGPMEFRLSHWTGALPELKVKADFNDFRKHPGTEYKTLGLVGQYVYRGKPVFGGKWSRLGYVLDQKGRNITLESLSPDYPNRAGKWTRVNMFLSHAPSGQFCFFFSPKAAHSSLSGFQRANIGRTGRSAVEKYRMGVPGPGVAPDAFVWFSGKEFGSYNEAEDQLVDDWKHQLAPAGSKNCQGND